MRTNAMIDKRVFLVGCPRSGTTLLQSMLYAHPEIYCFPETHFFEHLLGTGDRRTLRRKPRGFVDKLRAIRRDTMVSLGIVDERRRRRAWEILRVVPDFDASTRANSISLGDHAEAFVRIVDAACVKAARRLWIEKTPDHLFYVKRIQHYIPGATFIHIIRNGPDNVASLVDVAKKYPDQWGEQASLVENAVRRWNVALRESLQYRGDPRHYLVRYEELVSDPVTTLSGLCGFLGCDFDKKMVEDYSEKLGELVLDTEPWKRENRTPIRKTADTRFREVFSSVQQEYILGHLERWHA